MINIDRKLIKSSNYRLIKTGNILELYTYEQAYYYNMGKSANNDSVQEEDTATTKRTDNIARARRKIKRLINSNTFVYGYRPIFVTYTFASNVTSMREANAVFKAHHDHLRKYVIKRSLRYLAVPEFQKRGAIHYHAVYFDLPYISRIKDVFAESWGEGFVQIKAISHVRNVGAYIAKYFGKQWDRHRDKNSKSYYSATNLYQPETYRNFDILKNYDNLVVEHSEQFFSEKYGTIKYQQLKINNTQTCLLQPYESLKQSQDLIKTKTLA